MPATLNYLNNCTAKIAARLVHGKGLLTAFCAIFCLAWLQLPTSLSASVLPATYSVALGWEPAQGPVAGYQIWFGTAPGQYSTNIYVGNVTAATVTGLKPGTTYYFVVTDYDTAGNGSIASSQISFTPGTPLAQLAGLADGAATLTLSGLAGYAYEVQATEDFVNWSVIGTVTMGSAGTGSFLDGNAARHSKRFYRIHQL